MTPSRAKSRRFGRYQVIEKLGAGAMGAVYRARDESLGREVAVKTIRAPGLQGFRAEMFHARFENEARAVAALVHPHVVSVFDVGVEGATPFLVMELVAGPSLSERLEAGPLHPGEVRVLATQIAGALAAAHARGIVHRDVKPGNILEAEPGVWKLADFGVAHIPDSSLTLTGQFLGSPAYSAPEALERGEFGPASDVYGLGATLFQALAGEPPFGERGRLAPGGPGLAAPPPPLAARVPGLPPPLEAAVAGCLEPDPRRRLTAEGLVRALGSAPAASASNGLIALAIAVVVLVIGIGIGVGLRGSGDGHRSGAPSASGDPPNGGPPFGEPRGHDRGWEKRQEKRWHKVEDKLRHGDVDKALDELDHILEENPDDQRARQLYDRLELEAEARDDWED